MEPVESINTQPRSSLEDPDPEKLTVRQISNCSPDSNDIGCIHDVEGSPIPIGEKDPVFGNEAHAAIQYRTMEWGHASLLMLAETISLGVLALPQAMAILGLVPGILLIVILGIVATYTGLIIGQFKAAYPHVQSFADAGEMIAGPVGREVMAISQVLVLVFIQAAHILSFSIAMNALIGHGMCTVSFGVIGTVLCFLLGLPRTLKAVSFLSIFSCISILVAVMVAGIAIAASPPDKGHIVGVHSGLSLVNGIAPVMNIVLAYSGHVAFFTIAAELKHPSHFPRAVALLQFVCCTLYVLIGTCIYYFAGPGVASPALGSSSPIIAKITFGLALPTIIIAGVVNGSVACKYLYIRIWLGTDVIHQKSFKSLGSWLAVCASLWIASFAIAMVVPDFNSLLGLVGAMFCSWFSFGLPAYLWLFMNRKLLRRKLFLTQLNVVIFLLGATMCILGLYSSATLLSQGKGGKPYSCENNWHGGNLATAHKNAVVVPSKGN